MYLRNLYKWILIFFFAGFSVGQAWAQTSDVSQPRVPGPADPSRIERNIPLSTDDISKKAPPPVKVTPAPKNNAPSGAEQKRFILNKVIFEGATAFTQEELREPFADRLGKTVTLKEAYAMADAVSARYREAGYFLSRATVDTDTIKGDTVCICVREGYIKEVVLTDPSSSNYVVRSYIQRIKDEKPLTSATLESALLRLNDLPGQSFRAVLSALPGAEDGASMLTLIPQDTSIDTSIGFDNSGSKFLGPHEANMSISGSVMPLNQTTFYGMTSVDPSMLNYGSIHNSFTALPDMILNLDAGVTRAHPVHTLEPLDIDSLALNVSVGVKYQWIRQRQENFALMMALDGRDVTSDILGTPLTREQVRALRLGFSYDLSDDWHGSNVMNFKLSQGLDWLGASQPGELNLSRGQATPDFTKAEISIARLQEITDDWSGLIKFSGQLASGPLYSSEEFGYGGEGFGRAFDSSELVGDHGFATGLEIRYGGVRSLRPVNLEPYAFIDYGAVFNDDVNQVKSDSASSAGLGMRFATEWGQSANIGFAMPINHSQLAPLYGNDRYFPRIMMQFNQKF